MCIRDSLCNLTKSNWQCQVKRPTIFSLKLAFHDADTDTDILADILARMSVSVWASWNASFNDALNKSLTSR